MKARKLFAAGAIVAAALGMTTAAMAEDYVNNKPGGAVLGEQLSRSTGSGAVAGTSASRGAGLPVTGGDIAGLTAVGLAAVGAGTVMVRRSRSRRPSNA